MEPQLGKQLNDTQRQQVRDLLKEFEAVMKDLTGNTRLTEHRIETGSEKPVRLPPYRIPRAYRDAVQCELNEILLNDIIEPSTSEWAAPVVQSKKRDGCLGYRRINEVTQTDSYRIPRIDEIIDQLGKATFLTTLDLAWGYWQVPVALEHRKKTAFITSYGL